MPMASSDTGEVRLEACAAMLGVWNDSARREHEVCELSCKRAGTIALDVRMHRLLPTGASPTLSELLSATLGRTRWVGDGNTVPGGTQSPLGCGPDSP